MTPSTLDPGSVRLRRGEIIGAVGCALLIMTAIQSARVRSRSADLPPRGPVIHPPRTPFAAALHEAVECQWRAQAQVNQERDALEAWDPASIPDGGDEAWRLSLMARDRRGDLRQAQAAVQRATSLAGTPGEQYEAALLRAPIECNAGRHEVELQQARRLLELQPRNQLSWMVLRRAARYTGHSALEQKALAWLRAAADRSPRSLASGPGDSSRDDM